MDSITAIQNQVRLIILVFAGIAVIVGFRKKGLKLYKSTLIMAVLSPFLYGIFQQLPLWIVIPALFIILVYLFRKLIGEEAFGSFLGAILYDVLWRAPIKIFGSFGKGMGNIYKAVKNKYRT